MEHLNQKIYHNINFINRSENLGKLFSSDYKMAFKNYNNEEVIKIIDEFDYNAAFVKRDNFFKIAEKLGPDTFQFHIILRDGIAEFVFNFKKNNIPILDYCGSWAAICYKLGHNYPIKKPVFLNYNDLRAILKEAFSIYEDFKKELIFQEKIS